MKTIFVGGSRHVSRLPADLKQRLDNVVSCGHNVLVGDANGVDKAVQKHFKESKYERVTVFCSGKTPRNNLGQWAIRSVDVPPNARGFQFYAAKDREMAKEADLGLMIWDGKSSGTILNVLRLVQSEKIVVLCNVPAKQSTNIKSIHQWETFLASCSSQLLSDLKERATSNEWKIVSRHQHEELFISSKKASSLDSVESFTFLREQTLTLINSALESGDPTSLTNVLGEIARQRGMTLVARDTGLARESLYRSLDSGGNPEFATILKVLSSLGICLQAKLRA